MEANQNQLYHAELKNRLISGDAKERLRQLIEGWPEIILKVSSKHLASYLGITEVHLSRIKSEILKEGRNDLLTWVNVSEFYCNNFTAKA